MDLTTFGPLVILALIDSTSFGTLLIPIWLLLTPGRVRLGRLALYLSTILVCYFGIGLALATGGRAVGSRLTGLLESPVVTWIQIVVGIALLVLSFRMDTPGARERGQGRMARWRARAMGASPTAAGDGADDGGGADAGGGGAVLALMGLAVGAVAVEAASMLPYLAAIGIMTSSALSTTGLVATLAGYCAVMIAPALLLTLTRMVARTAVEPLLTRINDWLSRSAASATSWIVGIVGVLIALDGLGRLDGIDFGIGFGG